MAVFGLVCGQLEIETSSRYLIAQIRTNVTKQLMRGLVQRSVYESLIRDHFSLTIIVGKGLHSGKSSLQGQRRIGYTRPISCLESHHRVLS